MSFVPLQLGALHVFVQVCLLLVMLFLPAVVCALLWLRLAMLSSVSFHIKSLR